MALVSEAERLQAELAELQAQQANQEDLIKKKKTAIEEELR
jgi:hypothetical protein